MSGLCSVEGWASIAMAGVDLRKDSWQGEREKHMPTDNPLSAPERGVSKAARRLNSRRGTPWSLTMMASLTPMTTSGLKLSARTESLQTSRCRTGIVDAASGWTC